LEGFTVTAPKRPGGLDPAGASLWKRLTGAYSFDTWELAVVEAACRQADDIARLEQAIASDGLVVRGSQGQPRLSQAVTEVRLSRLAMARLLDTLRLPAEDESDATARDGRSARAKRAAEIRWSRARRVQERRSGEIA
jgi:hypothetical protein